MRGYPRWFNAMFLTTVFGLAILTGIAMIPRFLEMRIETELFWKLESDLRVGVFAGHVGVGLLSMLLLGALWAVHMRIHLKERKKLLSGLANAGLLIVLAITGLALQYGSSESFLTNSGIVHIVAGLAFAIVYFAHLLLKAKR